ncbi:MULTISPECIES: OadG family transporter subunit [unclassified Pseudoalteromonas]|uniref:OadG family transporter subunit n=1 Tax=unclassified Pseudoalteromonas TaxID=194690 RepID=UPI000CF71197|nr:MULTISPECIES: OadG family transporter subunit [unclassified Pseudoalteromonas]
MKIAALMLEAAGLMATGMLVVFMFLLLLIGALKLMSHFLQEDESTGAQLSTSRGPVTEGIPKAHIAAIAAAVHQYRKQ